VVRSWPLIADLQRLPPWRPPGRLRLDEEGPAVGPHVAGRLPMQDHGGLEWKSQCSRTPILRRLPLCRPGHRLSPRGELCCRLPSADQSSAAMAMWPRRPC